jgi:lantibiotic modifying enzyme
MTSPSVTRSGLYLQTAAEIGARLCREAAWHQEYCNWLGDRPEEAPSTGGPSTLTYRALGTDLYEGTSGVGLFLAELHRATGDAAARRTALGAIRQALRYGEAIPPSGRVALFSGWFGIAFAAARVATLLGDAELLGRAGQFLQRAVGEGRNESEFDLLTGKAGVIPALLILQELLEAPSLLRAATYFGDELLAQAEKSDAGYSWKSAASPTPYNLTGFSHGAAGAGYALLELYQVTGDARYRAAAEAAFRYERSWFDTEAGNWPDLREETAREEQRPRTLVFATAWCHGAPGIALSRLRAYEILGDLTYKAEAVTALQTTAAAVETALHTGMGNYSLCHGLAGNAEVLLYGRHVLGEECAAAAALAGEVARMGAERYAARGAAWPCGIQGETPALMLGLAGIGHFYLRLHDPAIPSLLLLRREEYRGHGRYR